MRTQRLSRTPASLSVESTPQVMLTWVSVPLTAVRNVTEFGVVPTTR